MKAFATGQDTDFGPEVILQAVHDIRSPLGVLKILVARLAQTRRDVHTDLLDLTIRRIEEISQDLLSRSRESRPVQRQTFDAAVGDLLVEKKIEHGAKINFSCTIAPELKEYWLEPGEPMRVLSNLINNAVEAGAEVIRIVARRSDKSIYLSVTDNGPGVPANVLTLMQNGTRVTHGKNDGHGLGLNHAWRFAHSVRGTLKFMSEPGQGTCVSLEIPQC